MSRNNSVEMVSPGRRRSKGEGMDSGRITSRGLKQQISFLSLAQASEALGKINDKTKNVEDKYKPDCGLKGEPPHLSYRKAMDNIAKFHPRKELADGTFKHHTFCGTHSGMHVPCSKLKGGDFDKYGVGVKLYFKFLKYMIFMFFCLVILAIPSALFFMFASPPNANTFTNMSSMKKFNTGLLLNTIGNVGEGAQLYSQQVSLLNAPLSNNTMNIQCAAGSVIGNVVVALYGNIAGSYHCPDTQKPDVTSGQCTGKLTSASNEANGDQKCVGYCWPGLFPVNNELCCANQRDSNLNPDFTNNTLIYSSNPACSSLNALNTVQSLCLGQANCTLIVDDTSPQANSLPSFSNNSTTLLTPTCASFASQLAVVVDCHTTTVTLLNRTVTKNWLLITISALDVFGCAFFLICISWLRKSEKHDDEYTHANQITANDYTLIIPKLPKHSSVVHLYRDIKEHFELIINDFQYQRYEGQWDKSASKLTVADINFAYLDQQDLVKFFTERGTILKKIDAKMYELMELRELDSPFDMEGINTQKKEAGAGAKKGNDVLAKNAAKGTSIKSPVFLSPKNPHSDVKSDWRENPLAKEKDQIIAVNIDTINESGEINAPLMKSHSSSPSSDMDGTVKRRRTTLTGEKKVKRDAELVNEINELQVKLKHIDGKIDNFEGPDFSHLRAQRAFVTFNEEEGVHRAKTIYPGNYFSWLCQKRDLLLSGHRVRLKDSVNPSDVNWEFVGVHESTRQRNKCITGCLTLLVVLISFVIIVYAQTEQAKFNRQYSTKVNCASFPSLTKKDVVIDNFPQFFDVVPFNSTGNTVGLTGKLQCYCKAYQFSSLLSSTDNIYATTFTNMTLVSDAGLLDSFFQNVTHINPASNVPGNPIYESYWASKIWGNTLCAKWILDDYIASAYKYLGIVGVITTNLILRYIIVGLVKFEKHKSKTSENASLTRKLFYSQLFNTAFLVFLVNFNLNGFTNVTSSTHLFGGFPLLDGQYNQFNVLWYENVGVSFIITMILFILQFNTPSIVYYIFHKISIRSDRYWTSDKRLTKRKTLADLEALYTGPEFDLSSRYASHVTVVFSVFIYSSGMPILLVIGLFYFFVTYFVEKFMFINYYKTPPALESYIAELSTDLLPLAVFFHLIVGLWMYGDPSIFQTGNLFTHYLNVIGSKGAIFQTITTEVTSTVQFLTNLFTTPNSVSSLTLSNILSNLPFMVTFTSLYLVYIFYHYILIPLFGVVRCCRKNSKLSVAPTYFEALPISVTLSSLERGTVKPELAKKYSKSLGNRIVMSSQMGGLSKVKDTVSILGLHSFDVNDNVDYREIFGFNLEAAFNENKRLFPRILATEEANEKRRREEERVKAAHNYMTSSSISLDIFTGIFNDIYSQNLTDSNGEPIISTKEMFASLLNNNRSEEWLAQIRTRQLFKLGDTDLNGYLTINDWYFGVSRLFPKPTKTDLANFRRIFGKVPKDIKSIKFNTENFNDLTHVDKYVMSNIGKQIHYISITNAGSEEVNGVYKQAGFFAGAVAYQNGKGISVTRQYAKDTDEYFWVIGKHPNVFYMCHEKFVSGFPSATGYIKSEGRDPCPEICGITQEDFETYVLATKFAAFDALDIDKSGFLDFSELLHANGRGNIPMAECLKAIQEADTNGDHVISLEEYQIAIRKGGLLNKLI